MRHHVWVGDLPSGHRTWICSRCGANDISLVEPYLDADGRLTLERGLPDDPAVILSLNFADCDMMIVREVMES
jgi:hypothetical protein